MASYEVEAIIAEIIERSRSAEFSRKHKVKGEDSDNDEGQRNWRILNIEAEVDFKYGDFICSMVPRAKDLDDGNFPIKMWNAFLQKLNLDAEVEFPRRDKQTKKIINNVKAKQKS